MHTHRRLTLPCLALVMLGCTPSNIARQASSAAVDQGAEELTKSDTQESLKEAAADPQLQAATQDMSEQIAEGVLKAMESPRAREQIAAMTRGVTQAAVQQMMAALSAPQTKETLVGLTQGMADAALKQTAASLQTDFRPAMRAMLQEDLAEGMAAALNDSRVQPAMGHAAQTVAYNAMLGANNGLGAAWSGEEGMLGEARGLPAVGRSWLWIAFSMLGLLTLMFISGAVMLVARARRAHSEVSRLESATLLLATAMREKQQTEQTDEIVALVQSALAGRSEQSGKHRILDAIGIRKAG